MHLSEPEWDIWVFQSFICHLDFLYLKLHMTIKKTFSFCFCCSVKILYPIFWPPKITQITKCQKTHPSQIFPLIPKQLSEFSKLKNQTQKLPLKIQKPKKSFKSQNVRKQTLPKYSHWFQNNFQNFQNSKIKLKNYPLKSKNLK